MPVVLDNDAGERVLLYGTDGAILRALIADSTGRLIVVGAGSGGAVEVVQDTPADLKTAVHGLDGATQRQIAVDATGRLIVVGAGSGGAVEVVQDTPADLKTAVHGLDGATQRQIAVDASGRARISDPRERSILKVVLSYAAAGVAPHGATTRATYTVPANRIAILESAQATILRDGATATPAASSAIVRGNTIAGAAPSLIRAHAINGVLGAEVHEVLGSAVWLIAGNSIDLVTVDASTGGTNLYDLSATLSEFAV